MRLGLSTSFWGLKPDEWAEKMVSLGCESVVFPVDCTAPDELIEEYAKEAAAHKLIIAEVGIWRNALAKEPAEAEKNLLYSVEQLKLADRLGADCCVNVAGAFGKRWDGGYRENFTRDAWNRTVSMIQEVIDRAEPEHTYFTIESMPWMVPTGPEEYLRLIEDVNRPHFAAHLDIINMINSPERYFFAEEFLDRTVSLLAPYLKSCHLKDIRLLEEYTFQLRECACGEGTFPIQRYIDAVNAVSPDIPMIIEHLKDDNAYEESVAYLKANYRF